MAIETTGRSGSIAVLSGDRVLRHQNLNVNQRTAATLAPAIAATFLWARESRQFPDLIAIADGPGSFTGLRIGVTTAKTLGYSLGLPIVAVDSVAAIAAAAFDDCATYDSLLVGLNAYRQQVFAGEFHRSDLLPNLEKIPQTWTAHPDTVDVLEDHSWQQRLDNRCGTTGVTGDIQPLARFADLRIDRQCDAIGVGLLGIRAALRGEFVDALKLVPRYLKLSAAEEKAAAKFG